jgi:ribonuclease Z
MDTADTALNYTVVFKPLTGAEDLLPGHSAIGIHSFPVEHRIPCYGVLITEKSKRRKLLPERCRYYEVPAIWYKKLQEGEDYERKDGFLVRNEWVTTEGKPDKKYAYCADTRYTESYLLHITGADLMYHESTYLEADEERAASRYHSTAKQAAQLARKAGAGRLLLGHYSSRYKDIEAFEQEAALLFPQVTATREGNIFEI